MSKSNKRAAVRAMREAGATIRQIAATTGVSHQDISAMTADMPNRTRAGRPRTDPELIERCIELRVEGMTYKNIAAATGLNVSTVRRHVCEELLRRNQ